MSTDIGMLKTAIPYVRVFKNKVFVVKLGGELCQPGAVLNDIVEQLTLLYQLGIKIVVVHGGGDQATELGDKLGVKSDFVNGRRVTSAAMLEVAKMSFAGIVNIDILAAFRRHGVPAVGLSGIDGNLVDAKKRPAIELKDLDDDKIKTVDYGLVGDVAQVQPAVVEHLLAGGYLPVICSLAADAAGQTLNVNADTLAGTLAVSLQATKYCLLTNVDGVMGDVNDPSSLITYMDLEQARELLESGKIKGGMIPKLKTCLDTIRQGIPRAHIVNGMTRDSLLREILTNEGSGTLIVANKAASTDPVAV